MSRLSWRGRTVRLTVLVVGPFGQGVTGGGVVAVITGGIAGLLGGLVVATGVVVGIPSGDVGVGGIRVCHNSIN